LINTLLNLWWYYHGEITDRYQHIDVSSERVLRSSRALSSRRTPRARVPRRRLATRSVEAVLTNSALVGAERASEESKR
jgi:hypothetical protein